MARTDRIDQDQDVTRISALDWRPALHLATALVVLGLIAVIVWTFARPLALLVLAITLAQALSPLVEWTERRVSRTTATALVYAALLGVAILVGWALLPTMLDQVQRIAQELPQMIDRLRNWLERWNVGTGTTLNEPLQAVGERLTSYAMMVPGMLTSAVLDLVVIIFLSAYWLIETPDLKRFVLSLWPEDRRRRTSRILDEMGEAMGGYIRGAAFDGMIMGGLAWFGLWLFGVPFAVIIGAFTAIAELVPYLGPLVAGAFATGAGLLVSVTKALQALGLYVVLQQVEGHLVTPNIMRSQTSVPAGVVLFAFVSGFMVGGILGGIVAIPIAAALRVLLVRALAPAWREAL